MTQPTISDVARAAGVSNATVSRALRGLGKVHPETRDRVFKAAAALNYIASPTAAGLASGRTGLVGIITPFMARWFFTAIMSSIEKTLRDHQHHILLIDLEMSPITRLSLTQGSLFKRVDGLIVINVEMQIAERDLVKRLGLPVVAVGYPFEDAPRIRIDDFAAVTLAAEHLIDLGHRSIAYLGKARSGADHKQTPSDRLAGFRDTLDRHRLSCPDEWVLDSDWSAFDAHGSALRLLSASERPTAILAASDEMGLGALAAARELGLDVPGDLSIIGIDDHELAAVFGLTTVRQDVAAQGTAAASAMLAELGLLDESFGGDRIFPVELVSRRSTGAPAPLG